MTHLKGYDTGGTIHVVINNQVGFTTPPESSRPTRYATDIAKIIESPVFHVNGDDPEMAVHAAKMAAGFRQRFGQDVLIELVCFRKHGHNELDEPSFTQPRMYEQIAKHPGPRSVYEQKLLANGVFTEAELEQVNAEVQESLSAALTFARDFRPRQEVFSFGDAWEGLGTAADNREAETALPAEVLQEIASVAAQIPDTFKPHAKVRKVYQQRVEMVTAGKGIDFGCAEMLAMGGLLREGTPVRLSGQDSGRGTFSHRHSVLHDQQKSDQYVPLNHLARKGTPQAHFEVLDSPLSEAAVLGFGIKTGNLLTEVARAEDDVSGRIVTFQVSNLGGEEGKTGTFKIQMAPAWAPRGVARFEVRTEGSSIDLCWTDKKQRCTIVDDEKRVEVEDVE